MTLRDNVPSTFFHSTLRMIWWSRLVWKQKAGAFFLCNTILVSGQSEEKKITTVSHAWCPLHGAENAQKLGLVVKSESELKLKNCIYCPFLLQMVFYQLICIWDKILWRKSELAIEIPRKISNSSASFVVVTGCHGSCYILKSND